MIYKPLSAKLCAAAISICLIVSIMCLFPGNALGAGSISQGFKLSDPKVRAGALVSYKTSSQNDIELANTAQASQLIGVVGDKSLVELSSNPSEVQVVVSGIASVFVSDINGEIKNGDKITASPLNGIGMKATEDSQIVGTAQADFASFAATEHTIADKDKKSHKVKVSLLPVQVGVTYYAPPKDKLSSVLPSFLQSVADSTAGKNVSPLRVLISSLVLLLGFVTATIILYASVRSSITSIGRNPLARTALLRGLFEVLLTAAGILIITAAMVYVILTS